VDFARNIHSAGTDLLTLINDILDLSKIESGTVTVEAEEITFRSLRDSVDRTFRHLAETKNLSFQVEIDNTLPRTFTTDPKRLQQILKNLLSNAFKFTSQGQVQMRVQQVTGGWSPDHPILRYVPAAIAIEVSDSGIGIAAEKQRLIFEAFQQADAGTSRKYGGTGLGLAISRELATLLGGEIRLASVPGQGSTFTLYLPTTYTGPARTALPGSMPLAFPRERSSSLPVLTIARPEEVVFDDRDEIVDGDSVLLIVDDDPHYARVLLGLARDRGFKGVVANRGHAALQLSRQYLPTAITLDVFLPDMLGWTVLNNLKLDPATRHIPVQML
jgi:CheY-like chemotaxis protein/two-component sensor histidine kinase